LALTTGVIGLGQMGRGIARNLDAAGVLAAAWDVVPAAREHAALSAGVQLVPPASLSRAADIVFLVVPSSREIEAILNGPDGLFAGERPGQVLVDLTTSHPADTRRLVVIAAEAGRGYLDCGTSGGASGADHGRLTLMVGGGDAALARARPALDIIAARIVHVGGSTAGHAMKLVHNMVCHIIFFALSEGCRLAERAGLDLATVIEVINAGNARSYVSEQRFPNHILSGSFDGRSRIANLAKDLGMATALARELGSPAVFAPLTSKLLDRAVGTGRADDDFTTLYRLFDELVSGSESPEPETE
jgi:3-hydroxyisobutyrate dehydrogenase